MIDPSSLRILRALCEVMATAGVNPWFEARILKDSSKNLNGTRIRSKRKDLDSVLKLAEERSTMLLPTMRIELRMYATVGASRGTFMGVPIAAEEKPADEWTHKDGVARPPGLVIGVANFSPAKNKERLAAELAAPKMEPGPKVELTSKDAILPKAGETDDALIRAMRHGDDLNRAATLAHQESKR
jgi:hypothetical protein